MSPDSLIGGAALFLAGVAFVRWLGQPIKEDDVRKAKFIARVEPHHAGGYSAFFQLAARPEISMTRYGSWWEKADALYAIQLIATEFDAVDELELEESCDGR